MPDSPKSSSASRWWIYGSIVAVSVLFLTAYFFELPGYLTKYRLIEAVSDGRQIQQAYQSYLLDCQTTGKKMEMPVTLETLVAHKLDPAVARRVKKNGIIIYPIHSGDADDAKFAEYPLGRGWVIIYKNGDSAWFRVKPDK